MKPDSIARLKDLVDGNREPENGMEKHFLKVIKGKNSPCTAEEKQWYRWWQSYYSQPKHDAVSVKSPTPSPTAEQSKRIAEYNLLVAQFKKTNESAKLLVTKVIDLRIPVYQSKRTSAYHSSKIIVSDRYNRPKKTQVTLSPNLERMQKEKEVVMSSSIGNGPKPKPFNTPKKELSKLKHKGPTDYTVDDGIAGSREANIRMRYRGGS